MRDQIVPPTLNLDNPDEGTRGRRPGPAHGQEARSARRAQQQLRLRRHQCQPGDEGGRLTDGPARLPHPASLASSSAFLAASAARSAGAGAGRRRAREGHRRSSCSRAPRCLRSPTSSRRAVLIASADSVPPARQGVRQRRADQGRRVHAARRARAPATILDILPARRGRSAGLITIPEGMPSILVHGNG